MPDNGNKDLYAIILTLLGVTALVIFFRFFSDEFSTGQPRKGLSGSITQVERGKRLSRNCTACHDLTSAKRTTLIGPPLWGIINSLASSQPGYKYSKAHIAAGKSRLVWTEENLDTYLTNPKAFIPGNRMAFAGIKVDEERWALLAYLKTLQDTQPEDKAKYSPTPASAKTVPAIVDDTISQKVRAKRGKIVAEKCRACHDLSSRRQTIVGPPLFTVVGRPAGGVTSFTYSEAFKQVAARGVVWTSNNLDQYLKDPKLFAPGTKMLFSGISDQEQRENLITYLKSLKP